jgi:hypothetical protein
MRHHQCARVGEVRPDRCVHVRQFTLAGQPEAEDHRVQAAHQVGITVRRE